VARFYFHLIGDGERIADDEGAEAANLDQAHKTALKAAADMTAEELKMGARQVSQRVIVADEHGEELLSVAVEAKVSELPIAGE
jgi:hypothetical protein